MFLAPGDRKRPSNDDIGDLVGEKRSGLDNSLNEGLRVPVDLIVLNLSFKTDEESLKKFFEQYGEVQYVEVCCDRLFFLFVCLEVCMYVFVSGIHFPSFSVITC